MDVCSLCLICERDQVYIASICTIHSGRFFFKNYFHLFVFKDKLKYIFYTSNIIHLILLSRFYFLFILLPILCLFLISEDNNKRSWI